MPSAELPALRFPRAGRSFRRPIAISAAVHAAVLALFALEARRVDDAKASRLPGPIGETRTGARGAEAVAYLSLPPYRPEARQPVAAPPRPPVVPIRATPVEEPAARASLAAVIGLSDLPATSPAGGSGTGAGPGIGPGRGSGAGWGPGFGGGEGEVFPPQTRYSILPPLPKPPAVRGKTFSVHFWVDATGRVTRVDVSPPIPDGEYRKEFVRLMYQYTFTPALRADGTPVAGETVLTITL
jgi:hypothetical protein